MKSAGRESGGGTWLEVSGGLKVLRYLVVSEGSWWDHGCLSGAYIVFFSLWLLESFNCIMWRCA